MHPEHTLFSDTENDMPRTRVGMSWVVVFPIPDSTYIPVPPSSVDEMTIVDTAINNLYCLQRAAELAWIAANPRNLASRKEGRFVAAICIGDLKELAWQERRHIRSDLARILTGQGMQSVTVSMAPCGCLVVNGQQTESTESKAPIVDAQPDVLLR